MFPLGKSLEVKLLVGVYLTLKESAKVMILYSPSNKVGGL